MVARFVIKRLNCLFAFEQQYYQVQEDLSVEMIRLEKFLLFQCVRNSLNAKPRGPFPEGNVFSSLSSCLGGEENNIIG